MPVARFAPRTFVQQLTSPGLSIPGVPQPVAINKYLCAVPAYGGNANATLMLRAVHAVARGTSDESALQAIGREELGRMVNGQGKMDHIRKVMRIIWDRRAQLQGWNDHGRTPLARHMSSFNPLQAMVDDRMFGLDCIGFVGRYLEASGARGYHGMYPRNYLSVFPPVRDIREVDDLCILVWVSGSHIAIIDRVVERHPNRLVVDICQSSGGGPQLNTRATLTRLGSASFLDFDAYQAAQTQAAREHRTLSTEDRTQLQRDNTTTGTTGYHNGIFFDAQGGTRTLPVPGHVYVGKMPGLTKAYV